MTVPAATIMRRRELPVGAAAALVACTLVGWASAAGADTGELSVRAAAVVHRGAVRGDGDEPRAVTYPAASVAVAYGLTFNWTTTLRYEIGRVAQQQEAVREADRVAVWSQWRHAALAGLAYTWSDELTPVVLVEGGVAIHGLTDRARLDCGRGPHACVVDDRAEDEFTIAPAIRGSLLYQLHWHDFWAAAVGAGVAHEDGTSVFAQVWLAHSWYL